ncbi:hypothetical protein CLU89_3869 [Acidovorax sp. 30]|nr:hypothetical protein CLU87_0691 [Acidovorax sp. 59]PKW04190.1 hypothetical protein CLU89_3869 [Acidovorax sp. 30]
MSLVTAQLSYDEFSEVQCYRVCQRLIFVFSRTV